MINDYFAAASDDQAAQMVHRSPGDRGPGTSGPIGNVVVGGGIEPVVKLMTLYSLLVDGVALEDLAGHASNAGLVAMVDDGEQLVLNVCDELRDLLAVTSDEALAEVAGPWAETEEFGGYAGSDELLTFLREFAVLARNAVRDEDHIYCWMSV